MFVATEIVLSLIIQKHKLKSIKMELSKNQHWTRLKSNYSGQGLNKCDGKNLVEAQIENIFLKG